MHSYTIIIQISDEELRILNFCFENENYLHENNITKFIFPEYDPEKDDPPLSENWNFQRNYGSEMRKKINKLLRQGLIIDSDTGWMDISEIGKQVIIKSKE